MRVRIANIPDKKRISTIRSVRAATGLSLIDAKLEIDKVPRCFFEPSSEKQADELREDLAELGVAYEVIHGDSVHEACDEEPGSPADLPREDLQAQAHGASAMSKQAGLTQEGAQRLLDAYRSFWANEGADRWRRGEAEPGSPLGDLCAAFMDTNSELEQSARWGPRRND